MSLRLILTTIALAVSSLGMPSGFAQSLNDDTEYEMKVQRACEAAIWGMPAVSVDDIELSIRRDLGGKFGDVAYFSKPMASQGEGTRLRAFG